MTILLKSTAAYMVLEAQNGNEYAMQRVSEIESSIINETSIYYILRDESIDETYSI